MVMMMNYLSEEDNMATQDCNTPSEIWVFSQKKYQVSSASISIASIHIAQIIRFYEDFKFGSTADVELAWTTLQEYRCKMVQAAKSMKSTYSDKRLYLILTQQLPKADRRLVDSLNTNSTITIEDKIKILRQFAEENNRIQREGAHVTYSRRQKSYMRHKMNQ
jgi:uncharacterized protein with WD repeat